MKRVFLLLVAVCALMAAGCGDDNGNGGTGGNPQPTISSITPNQVSRGQQRVVGRITGTNLGGVVSVTLGDGITVEQFSAVNSTEIEIRFNVAQNAAAGTRTITVNTSAGSVTNSLLFTVSSNRAPQARFVVSPTKGAKNTTFTVDATTSSDPDGNVATYRWEFGDNKSANGRVATHKYDTGGNFQIVLIVTDNDGGANTATRQVEVADGLAPVARFTVTPASGDIGTTFTLDASASSDNDGNVASYSWRFGDGSTATGRVVRHTYNRGGVFTVQLTVTDNEGLQSALDRDLRVENFNTARAEDEIRDLLERFFFRFSRLETLDTEIIVEGWSDAPACRGRDREIAIINEQKLTLAETTNEIVGPIPVLIRESRIDANANVVAEFEWREKSGVTGKSRVLHRFSLIFDDGEWQVCNFQVDAAAASARKLFKVE